MNLAFGQKTIFKNCNFQIEHGDKIGLIGLNGMGKSSLFKILLENISPDISTPPFVFDKATAKQGENQKYSVFLVDQKFRLPKKATKVKDYFYEYHPELKDLHLELDSLNEKIAKDHNEDDIERQHQVMDKLESLNHWNLSHGYESYLKSFGLEDLNRDVADLSGGEQRKVLLALGLTSDANLILWDEPTNHLDIETIASFEEELLKTEKTFIIISHDRYLLSKVTNRIFHINRAEITAYKGSYADYIDFLDSQEEARKKMLAKLKNSLKRETDWMRQGIRARGTRSKKRVENFHDLAGKVSQLKSEAKKSMDVMINKSGRKTKMLAEFKSVDFSYDTKTMFKDINFTLYKGDKIGVIGENGVGKSTLMKLISRQLEKTAGKTKYADDLKICYFSQTKEELDSDKSPFDLLGDGEDFIHFKNGRSIHVATYFQNYLFDHSELHRPLSSFSGGEINRLQLALNLKNEADIWIFDEPTNDLDIESIEILEQKLASFDGTVIIISHDRTFLENITNKIWLVENQNIELFTSGYSHVAPYLEACALEKEIEEQRIKESRLKAEREESKKQKIEQEKASQKNGLSQAEKQRLNKMPDLIAGVESSISEIDDLLGRFDYGNLDAEKSELVGKLSSKKDSLEEELLALYEESEELESRV
jgi:ATP-binding cassette subfamily F protein uup